MKRVGPSAAAADRRRRWRCWSGGARAQRSPDLPSPVATWEESKLYILEPLEKRGEMDQGIGLLAYYSLMRVAQGFLLGIADRARRSASCSACRRR